MRVLNRFIRDRRGNVAMLFSLAALGAIGLAGLAVEYSRADAIKTRISAVADAAALAAARIEGSEQDRQDVALKTFNASMGKISGVVDMNVVAADVTADGKLTGFRVSGSLELETTFGRLFGQRTLDIGFNAQATSGAGDFFEVALALDVTGSMQGHKIDALKVAAKDMVRTLSEKAASSDQVKFSIVPFAQYVNVGLANRYASWIDVAPDTSTVEHRCRNERELISQTNCRTETYIYYDDGVQRTGSRTVCDNVYGEEQQVCRDITHTSTWRGCVGSRNYPLDTQVGSYATRIPGLHNTHCPGEILPLTSDQGTINATLDGMTARGETYIPTGLVWGWRTLTPGGPFTQSERGTRRINQALVLMTDGFNTKSANYPDHEGSNTDDANRITREICANMKAPGVDIAIFTIAFDVTDVTIRNILRDCSSAPATHYFDASNSAQLAAAFQQIGQALTALRLER